MFIGFYWGGWITGGTDDALTSLVKVDMFDAHILPTAMTVPSKNLDLRRIGFQQPSRG